MALDRTWFNALVDDDGSGLTGSVWDKADIANLLNSVDAELARIDAAALPCICSLTTNVALAYLTGVWTDTPFSVETYDPRGMHTGSLPTVYFPTAGVYWVTASLQWDDNVTGQRGMRFLANTGWNFPFSSFVSGNPPPCMHTHSGLVVIATAGMSFTLQLFQNSGINLWIQPGLVALHVWRLSA